MSLDMKQTSFILLLPVIGILEVILAFEDVYLLVNYVYFEMVIICICGYLGMKRDMWLLLAIFYGWVVISSLSGITFFSQYAAVEAVVFGMLVYWVYRRPERIPSDPPSDTVQLAFYYGNKSPFIARIASLVGLPVTGVAVVLGNEAVIPVGKTGRLEKRSRATLRQWIILDTRIPSNPRIRHEFYKAINTNVRYAGCLYALLELIFAINPDYAQENTPSGLMSRVLNNKVNKT